MKIFVAHSSNFDFREKLYEPLRESALNNEHEIFLPQEADDDYVTLEFIKSCEIVVVDVSMSSTGAGIEMGWANASGVPILSIYEEGSMPSESAEYVSDEYVEYADSEDMIQKITDFVAAHS